MGESVKYGKSVNMSSRMDIAPEHARPPPEDVLLFKIDRRAVVGADKCATDARDGFPHDLREMPRLKQSRARIVISASLGCIPELT